MDGVILFADDKVFERNTLENRLYLRLSERYPVLAVESIDLAAKAIKSIGTFSAIILDWEFKYQLGGAVQTQNPNALLDTANFYSLVYVFSHLQIPNATRRRLRRKFGTRIIFRRKSSSSNATQSLTRNFTRIKDDITNWQSTHENEVIPQNWSNSINQSIQHIFSKLSKADPNWIIELYRSAGNAVNPEIEVINLLQTLLQEKIVTDRDLVTSIRNLVANPPANITNAGTAELFQKIYYTDLRGRDLPATPIMTGDVFTLSSKNSAYGIIITPECDIRKVVSDNNQTFQILKFRRNDFKDYVWKIYNPQNTANFVLKPSKKEDVCQWFNQPDERLFFLPSFPYKKNEDNYPAVIDFSNSIEQLKYSQVRKKNRICKLNAPFIQQLRQRYLSYVGRIGVPTIPSALRTMNVAHF